MVVTKEQLETVGGNYWESPDGSKKRVYFNTDSLMQFIGLECEFYGTGNISSATLNGEHISNSQARKLLSDISTSKHYFDLTDNTWHSPFSKDMKKGVHEAIEKHVKLHGPVEVKKEIPVPRGLHIRTTHAFIVNDDGKLADVEHYDLVDIEEIFLPIRDLEPLSQKERPVIGKEYYVRLIDEHYQTRYFKGIARRASKSGPGRNFAQLLENSKPVKLPSKPGNGKNKC